MSSIQYDKEQNSILVLGSGTLGGAVLTALINSANRPSTSRITLASRTAPQYVENHLSGHDIAALVVDIPALSQSELSRLFSSFTVVISCAGMSYPPGTQLKLTSAIIEAGTPRYFPWQFGMDYDAMRQAGSKQDLFLEQIKVRDLLRAQERTQWTVVTSGVFADFLLDYEAGFGVFEKRTELAQRTQLVVRALGSWENKITATMVEDIAATVSQLVFEHPATIGVVFIAGQTISYRQIAQAVGRACGENSLLTECWDLETLLQSLKADPLNDLKKYRATFAVGTGVSWEEDQCWNHTRGLQFKGLDTWVHKYCTK